MNTNLQVILAITAILILLFLIIMILRNKLQLRYAILWLLVNIILVLFAFFPGLAAFLSHLVGIETASNGVFLMMLGFLFLICLSFTIIHSRNNAQQREMAQRIALLEYEIRKMKKNQDNA